MHFLDVDVHFALPAVLNLALELVDFRALATNDDAGPRGKHANHQLVRGALDIKRADARRAQPILELFAQLYVLVQQVGIITVGVPARFPGLVVTQPEPVWMRLLSQSFLRYFFFAFRTGFFFPASAWRAFFTAPATPFCDSASAAAGAASH